MMLEAEKSLMEFLWVVVVMADMAGTGNQCRGVKNGIGIRFRSCS